MIEVYTSPEQVIRIFVYIIIGIGALGVGTILYDFISWIRKGSKRD